MQIQVRKLRDVLALLERSTTRSNKGGNLPVLSNVLFADKQAVATNLSAIVSVDVPEANETILLKPKETGEVLAFLDGNLTAQVTQEGAKVSIQAGAFKGVIYPNREPEDFPRTPVITTPLGQGALDGDALVRAMGECSVYAAKQTDRPVLTAVALVMGQKVEVVGADGFRLAHTTLRDGLVASDGVAKSLLFPADAVKHLVECWAERAATVQPELPEHASLAVRVVARRMMKVVFDDGLLELSFGGVRFMVRTVQGTYPNYEQLLPKEDYWRLQVHAQELFGAVKQVEVFARDSSGIVRLRWEKGGHKVTVSAFAEELGSAEVPIAADVVETQKGKCADICHIAFNVKYLLEYLKAKRGLVTIKATTSSSPGLLQEGQGAEVLIMPMFVKHPEEAPTATDSTAAAEDVAETPVSEAGSEEAQTEGEEGEAEAGEAEPAAA